MTPGDEAPPKIVNSGTQKPRRLGPQLIAGGSVLVLVALFAVSWYGVSGGPSLKLWKLTAPPYDPFGHRPPILLLVIAIVTLLVAAAYFAGQLQLKPWLAALGLIEFGYVLELGFQDGPITHNNAVGGYAALVAGVIVAVGAALSLELQPKALGGVASGLRQAAGSAGAGLGAASSAARSGAAAAGASTAGAAAASASPAAAAGTSTAEPSTRPASDETTDLSGGPPPGWYPDPSGQHPERLWDGKTWTDDVR